MIAAISAWDWVFSAAVGITAVGIFYWGMTRRREEVMVLLMIILALIVSNPILCRR